MMGSWDQSPVYVPISEPGCWLLAACPRILATNSVEKCHQAAAGHSGHRLIWRLPIRCRGTSAFMPLLPIFGTCTSDQILAKQQAKILPLCQMFNRSRLQNKLPARNKEPEPPLSSSWCDVVRRQLLKSSLCWPACCLLSHLQLVSASISQVRLGIRWRSIPIRKVQ